MIRNLPKSPGMEFPLILGITVLLLGALGAILPLGAALLGSALLGGVLVLMAPLNWIIVVELFLATVIAGTAEYFAGISQAHWIPYLLGLLLGFRALLERLNSVNHKSRPYPFEQGTRPWFLIPMWVYFLTIVISLLVNLPPLLQLLVALKNYVFMWGVLAALLVKHRTGDVTALIWKGIVVVACLQLPVVLYQKFFIASKLSDAGGAAGLSYDAINGTFGGGLLGGHSAAMALTIVIALAIAGVAWRARKISTGRLILIAGLALPSVFFAEVKAVTIWLGVAGLIIFVPQIKTRPGVFLAGVLGAVVVIGGIAIAYKTMYYEGTQSTDWQTVYEKQVVYFFDTDKFNPATREMGRVGSLAFWWDRHEMAEPVDLVIGHGPGASRGISSFAVGEAARRFTFLIDTSAATALLWDVGLLGGLSFGAILLLGALEGYRLSLLPKLDPALRAGLECSAIGLLLILSGLIYNRDAIDAAAIQFLLLFFLAVVWRGKAAATGKSAGR